MLGVFAFAVIVWVTEAVEYAASSVILLAIMGILLGSASSETTLHELQTHVRSRATYTACDRRFRPYDKVGPLMARKCPSPALRLT